MTEGIWRSTFGDVTGGEEESCEQATPRHSTAMSRTLFIGREGYGLSEGGQTAALHRTNSAAGRHPTMCGTPLEGPLHP